MGREGGERETRGLAVEEEGGGVHQRPGEVLDGGEPLAGELPGADVEVLAEAQELGIHGDGAGSASQFLFEFGQPGVGGQGFAGEDQFEIAAEHLGVAGAEVGAEGVEMGGGAAVGGGAERGGEPGREPFGEGRLVGGDPEAEAADLERGLEAVVERETEDRAVGVADRFFEGEGGPVGLAGRAARAPPSGRPCSAMPLTSCSTR